MAPRGLDMGMARGQLKGEDSSVVANSSAVFTFGGRAFCYTARPNPALGAAFIQA